MIGALSLDRFSLANHNKYFRRHKALNLANYTFYINSLYLKIFYLHMFYAKI